MITNQNGAHAIAECGFESALVQGKQHSKNAVRLRLRLLCRYPRFAEANRMQVKVDQGSTGARDTSVSGSRSRTGGASLPSVHPTSCPGNQGFESGCVVRRLACRHESREACPLRDRNRDESQNRRRSSLRSLCVEDFCAVCTVFGEQRNHDVYNCI